MPDDGIRQIGRRGDAIDQDIGGARPPPIDREVVAVVGEADVSLHARREKDQRIGISLIKGKVDDTLAVDHLAHGGGARFDQRRGGGDLHGLGGGADFQSEVDARGLVDVERDSGALLGVETRGFDGNGIGPAGRERGERVAAIGGGGSADLQVGRGIDGANLDVGHGRSRGIENNPFHRGADDLASHGGGGESGKKHSATSQSRNFHDLPIPQRIAIMISELRQTRNSPAFPAFPGLLEPRPRAAAV